ncbi:MAG: DUF3726 domain-containing protein [Pseudomonadota bacterium]
MTTVDLSRNEFLSTVQKACVGAGSDSALAADIANACLELEAAGLASLAHLLPLLEAAAHLPARMAAQPYAHSQNGFFTHEVVMLRNGASAMDHLCLATLTVAQCDDLVLLAALIVSGCRARGRFARIIAPGIPWAHLDHAYVVTAPERLVGPITVRFVPVEDHAALGLPPLPARLSVGMAHWAALKAAADAVLVPANDTTRLRDAGAGLNDND